MPHEEPSVLILRYLGVMRVDAVADRLWQEKLQPPFRGDCIVGGIHRGLQPVQFEAGLGVVRTLPARGAGR
ncbi:hypothetical protein D3C75_1230750 [compost metagenome]